MKTLATQNSVTWRWCGRHSYVHALIPTPVKTRPPLAKGTPRQIKSRALRWGYSPGGPTLVRGPSFGSEGGRRWASVQRCRWPAAKEAVSQGVLCPWKPPRGTCPDRTRLGFWPTKLRRDRGPLYVSHEAWCHLSRQRRKRTRLVRAQAARPTQGFGFRGLEGAREPAFLTSSGDADAGLGSRCDSHRPGGKEAGAGARPH